MSLFCEGTKSVRSEVSAITFRLPVVGLVVLAGSGGGRGTGQIELLFFNLFKSLIGSVIAGGEERNANKEANGGGELKLPVEERLLIGAVVLVELLAGSITVLVVVPLRVVVPIVVEDQAHQREEHHPAGFVEVYGATHVCNGKEKPLVGLVVERTERAEPKGADDHPQEPIDSDAEPLSCTIAGTHGEANERV